MIKKMKLVSCFLAGALFFSSMSVEASSIPNDLTQEEVNKLTPLLRSIAIVPDSLLVTEKSSELTEYFKNKGITVKIQNEEQGDQARSKRGIPGCTLALGTVLVTTSISIAKLKNIKKYVEELGGVEQAVLHIYNDASVANKTRTAAGALTGLLVEVTGIKELEEECKLHK
ncbi:hypothetical protein [Paenibacillus popilliae]|uniref:3'-phosphoadenosine 5'-phosphosulfate sulfotransferase/FAD synthetase n=1 Tax=Paenibacillus popilliae ATCC 14706 TaxID=1212764 RepID=M9LP00_PAEPP|nr:hypothetical protein [Paenibacillus popilliae]GAC42146.1 3'-phosphoadenosine 5'-phosphosulfate sulfotransferase/FAD synthetase [Paenibacillus popilliae ATCC 14706]